MVINRRFASEIGGSIVRARTVAAAIGLLSIQLWTPIASAHPGHAGVDLTNLPLGDGKISSDPAVGYVWRCGNGGPTNGGGAFRDGPWIHVDGTYDLTAKYTVDGNVSWSGLFNVALSAASRQLTGNGLPSTHGTGEFPVRSTDDAYQYDRNPNRIQAQSLVYNLPTNPSLAPQASCLTPGAIGVLTTGVVVFDALDAERRDAVAHEIQDQCQGHPERMGAYHYHSLSLCIDDSGDGHSTLVGYALDGFGIYGRRGAEGETLQTADLDECHGHSHTIEWDGQLVEMYHYHATWEFPYTLGCFRGTPARTADSGQGQQPQGPQGQQEPRGLGPGGRGPR